MRVCRGKASECDLFRSRLEMGRFTSITAGLTDQKEVLFMRIYKDMSFKEISENTGVSMNIALGRMRYALINLRKIIRKTI